MRTRFTVELNPKWNTNVEGEWLLIRESFEVVRGFNTFTEAKLACDEVNAAASSFAPSSAAKSEGAR